MSVPKVSVVVTTRNEERNIGRLLESVKRQSYPNIEIITVDNKSTDRTKVIAQQYGRIYEKGPERSAQRNFGVRAASGEYVLILDADMELTREVVAACVQEIKKHVAVIIPEASVGKHYWERVKALERNCYIGDGDMELPRFYPRQVFLQLGGFDEQITGPEIEDLYGRALRLGTVGRINTFIIHHEQMAQLRRIIQKKYYYCKSLYRYLQKNQALGKRQFRFVRPAFVRNWKAFLQAPHLTLGFVVMRLGESIAAVAGLLQHQAREKKSAPYWS